MTALLPDDSLAGRLLPCPFCGCKVVLIGEAWMQSEDAVGCDNCNAEIGSVEQWNRREAAAALAAQGEVNQETVERAMEAFLASTGQAHTVTDLQRHLTRKCMRAALEAITSPTPKESGHDR